MEAERQHRETPVGLIQPKQGTFGTSILDNRPQAVVEAKLVDTIRRKESKSDLPDILKTDSEKFSRHDLQVHHNADKPLSLQAFHAQGTKIQSASAQEKSLFHESWHAVQHKQAPARSVPQSKGEWVNDEKRLERDVNMMDRETLSASSGEQDLVSFPGNPLSSVVQRAVGFEFETGWQVRQKSGESLQKGDRMRVLPDFEVTADEAGGGLSEIEFITRPFDKEEELLAAMDEMTFLTQAFIGTAQASDWLDFNWDNYIVKPVPEDKNDKMKAGPQITFGSQLDKIPFFPPGGTNMGRLVDLIKIYIANGSGGVGGYPFEYPKQIADGALLARTDFAHLLNLALEGDKLSRSVLGSVFQRKSYFSKTQWLSYFREVGLDQRLFLGVVPAEIQKPVFKKYDDMRDVLRDQERAGEVNRDESRRQSLEIGRQQKAEMTPLLDRHTPPLTVRAWLNGIYDGVDLLTQVEDAESLGSFGNKTELVSGTQAPIFEARNFQMDKKDQSEWKNFAKENFERIADSTGADVNDLSRPKP